MKIVAFFLLPFLWNITVNKQKEFVFKSDTLDAYEQMSTKSANVTILKKEFIIAGLNENTRRVWVYLPPNYNETTKNYAVIYMHDGQNLFDNITSFIGEWEIDETLNNLYKKTGKSFIVVGIENGGKNRIAEYTPYKNEKYGGGKGDIYITFLANELKPYIDKNYRTKKDAKNTAIIGSSLGGLISFYGGLKYPDVFGKIGALSPSFWFSDKIDDFAKRNATQKKSKIYLLAGEKESETMVSDTKKMSKLLSDNGFPFENIKTKIVKNGTHSESFWKAEFLESITFLFNL